jgi:hypothetical protein
MFTVVLDEEVKAELAAIWVAAGSAGLSDAHRALTAINERLTTAPYERSESREGADRVMFDLPVGVRYVVYDAIARVNVLHVWYVHRRGQP